MPVSVAACGSDEAYIVGNLYPLYLHDLSAFSGDVPNQHGVLMAEPEAASSDAYAPLYDFWWQHPTTLRPLLIRVDGHVAGFALLSSASPSLAAPHWEAEVVELFVVAAYRGKGVARAAVAQILTELGGTVGQRGVRVLDGNNRALAFWRASLTAANLAFAVEERTIAGMRLVLIRF